LSEHCRSWTGFFRGLYLTKVRDSISSYLVRRGVSVLEINAYLVELSDHLKDRITPMLEEYGISLLNFFVNDISVPEDDPAVITLKDALAKRAKMDIVGYNYVQERSFDTLEGAATNPGSGQVGVMGAGIGLGMGFGIGGAMGNQAGGLAQSINVREMKKCPACNADMYAEARFCSACGKDTQQSAQDAAPSVDTTNCNVCGSQMSKKSKFCPQCGDSYDPCVFCGADISKDAEVCHVCGRALPKPCPKCGNPIPSDKMKFCPECGESLASRCPGCNAPIEGDPRFCPECGNNLKENEA
jgi:membrane protease subunit (stomatin/prohibitin family)